MSPREQDIAETSRCRKNLFQSISPSMRQNLIAVSVLVIGGGLAMLIAVTGPEVDVGEEQHLIPFVSTMRVSTESVQMKVHSQGVVYPKTESELVAEVAGLVVAVSPAMVSGGFYKEGEMLARIEQVDYEDALEDSEAYLVSARSELANAERHHKRQMELSDRESASESQLDEAMNRLTLARAALRRATVAKARSERNLARTVLTAPYDGRVLTERIDVGQFVQRGEAMASLYSTDAAEVLLPIQDEDMAFLPLSLGETKTGTRPTQVLLHASFTGAEHTWEGVVTRTEGELDTTTRMINLIAEVDEPYRQSNLPPLVAGLFVHATILGEHYDSVVAIPRSALQADGRVYVVGNGNRLEFREVEVLRVAQGTTYVSNGLRDGEIICVEPWRDAIDGQQVRPILSAPLSEQG